MSIRTNFDVNQFEVVAVPSAAEQDTRRRELQQVVHKTIKGSDASYDSHINWLRSSGKERARQALLVGSW